MLEEAPIKVHVIYNIIILKVREWHIKEGALEKQTSMKNVNCCIQHRNSIKMMQESLKSKYNKLLSFRHEEVII